MNDDFGSTDNSLGSHLKSHTVKLHKHCCLASNIYQQ